MRRFCGFFLFLSSITLLVQQTELGAQTEPAKKEAPKYEWPKMINGKNLQTWVKEMKEHPDPSIRELAVRTVPLFGPDARAAASANLVYALKEDRDWAVRMSALTTLPILGVEEKDIKVAIATMIGYIRSGQFQTRYDAIICLGNCGPVARDAIPAIVDFGLKGVDSWQIRRVSATALSQIGSGTAEDGGPDKRAIIGLIEHLPIERSVQVRRDMVKALMVMGIPSDKETWTAMRAALNRTKKDPDKSTGIWARICLMRSEEKKVTEKDPNANELAAMLKSTDNDLRTEVLQALGQMGSEVAFLIPELKGIIDTEKDIPVVGTAIWTLSTMGSHGQEILVYLKKIEKDHSVESIRKTATEAIKWMTEIKKEEMKDPKKEAVPKK